MPDNHKKKGENEDTGQVEDILCSISINITEKNNLPCIVLRKEFNNPELIKKVISCAFHERPITLLPKFPDKIKSIGSLVEKGILYRKDKQFYFTI